MNIYNNGDKVYTVGDIDRLERENTELKSQVELLRDAYKAVSKKIHDIDDTETDSEEIADALWQDLFQSLREGYEICQATPAQCPAEIKAQAVEDSADELSNLVTAPAGMYSCAVIKLNLIAKRIRQQAKGGD